MPQSPELYLDCAELFRDLIPWQWTPVDEVVSRLENRGLFDVPGFCESTALRKTLVYLACLHDPACVQMSVALMAYGPTTMIRRVA